MDSAALQEASRLDGCYVLKTDLPESAASKEVVHARYKDLAQVEQAFRTCKTAHLETRPIYVRTAAHTRGHVLVVSLHHSPHAFDFRGRNCSRSSKPDKSAHAGCRHDLKPAIETTSEKDVAREKWQ